jgi:SAM-dependent methyltransferase
MTPIIASATDLPFEDNSFDAVVASDVLEHIPPELRASAVREALRVARNLVVFCFPCGTAAHNADRTLRETYVSKHLEVPIWLEEHMTASFPDDSLFDNLSGWNITRLGNESIRFHSWMMQQELRRPFVRASNLLLRFAPWLLEPLLRLTDREPYYRQVFVLSRCT